MPYKSGRGGDQVTWLRVALYGRDLHIATGMLKATANWMTMLNTAPIAYVWSRSRVVGISAATTCESGAHPSWKPTPNIVTIAVMAFFIPMEGSETVPRPPIVKRAADCTMAPAARSGLDRRGLMLVLTSSRSWRVS